LRIWKDQPPSTFDFPEVDEVFPAASYQYVLYGMGFAAPGRGPLVAAHSDQSAAFRQIHERARALSSALSSNRDYLNALRSSAVAERVPAQ
jgi:hypothetical protein